MRASLPTLNGGDGDLPREEPRADRPVLRLRLRAAGLVAVPFADSTVKLAGPAADHGVGAPGSHLGRCWLRAERPVSATGGRAIGHSDQIRRLTAISRTS